MQKRLCSTVLFDVVNKIKNSFIRSIIGFPMIKTLKLNRKRFRFVVPSATTESSGLVMEDCESLSKALGRCKIQL